MPMNWVPCIRHLAPGTPDRRAWSRLTGPRIAPGGTRTGLSTVLLSLMIRVAAPAQDRVELVNQSNQPWTLALVEGSRPMTGTLECVDKFSGRLLVTLCRAGDATTLAPQSRTLLIFRRKTGYLYEDFILQDHLGHYAEYVANLRFLTSTAISIQLVAQHVGFPLNREGDGAVKQFINDAIDISDRAITIRPNALESARPEGFPPGDAQPDRPRRRCRW